jgi:hypothetical protein
MIDALIYLAIVLLVLIVVYAIIKVAASEFGISPAWVRIVGYILALIFLIIVLNTLGLLAPRSLRLR